MKIKEKMGNFMEKHGGELIACGGMIIAYGTGIFMGQKLKEMQCNVGLATIFLENPEIQKLMDTAIENIKKNK